MTFIKQLLTLALPLALLTFAARGQAGAVRAQDTSAQQPVTVTVTVVNDRNLYLTGLDKASFVVYENKSEREVVSVSADEVPVSLGIVFDMTESVTFRGAGLIDDARRAVLELAKKGNKANEYFVMGFTNEARLLTDWTRDAAKVADGLNALPSLQGKGSKTTAFYDATYEATRKLDGGSNAKRALLIVSDGTDNVSRHKLEDVRRQAAENGALVYALAIYSDADSSATANSLRRLGETCRASGGWTFYVKTAFSPLSMYKAEAAQATASVKTALQTLALELRNQYSVSFKPSDTVAEGEWLRMEGKARMPNKPDKMFPARAREGYFLNAGTR